MNKNEIIEKTVVIFKEVAFRDLKKDGRVWEKSIFGKDIGLQPTEAYFLLDKIEKEFDIQFPNCFVLDGNFNILQDIVDEIDKCMSEKA